MKKSVGTNEMNKEIDASIADPVLQSRRRLLKLGAYVPPAILGMAIISSAAHASGDDKSGGGNIGSCNPNACSPCNAGKKSTNKDKSDCRNAQKKRK